MLMSEKILVVELDDDYQFQCDSTDEGKDISEGEAGYRIEERGGKFFVLAFLQSDPLRPDEVEAVFPTRGEAEAHVVELARFEQCPNSNYEIQKHEGGFRVVYAFAPDEVIESGFASFHEAAEFVREYARHPE